MSNMVKLADLCIKITDGSHSSPNSQENGYPMLSVKDMKENGFSYNDCKYISKEDYKKMCDSGCKPEINDILIAKDGSYLKHVFVITEEKEQAILSSIGILKPDVSKVNPYYIKYYLSSDFVKNEVAKKYVSGSALPRIILKNFANIEIPYISLDKQNKIVKILKSIDDKIENNNKINVELESMAKTIYDYWFLQFEFPNEDGKPYKSSGGKMVWNEELKREIPEGWECCTLSDIINISSTKINSKEIEDRVYVPIEVIPRNRMSFYETVPIEKATTGLCPFDAKSILLSNRRVYFHKVSISPYNGVTRDTVIIINPKSNNNLGYVFQLVNSDHFIQYATLNSYGTEQPVLSPLSVMNYKITYPKDGLDKKYSEYVNEIINKVLLNQKQNQELTYLRDFLLPLLMNGQVGFKEVALDSIL